MTCPCCNARVAPASARCDHCGFCIEVPRACLGSLWVRLERVTDAAGCLRLADTQRLEQALDDFERQFPQCFFAVYIGALPAGLSVSELGFWLLNHGAFNTHQISKRNDFGMMLVIDPFVATASFTIGYALEPVFQSARLTALVNAISSHLRGDRHAKAIQKALVMATKTLRSAAQSAVWAPSQTPTLMEDITDMGFQPLQSRHRGARDPAWD